MRFWKTYQKRIIFDTLKIIHDEEVQFKCWQQEGSLRSMYDAHITHLDAQKCKIKLHKNSIEMNGNIEKTKPVYAHIPIVEAIFKKEQYTVLNGILEFPLPSEIQFQERRKIKRFYYKYQDHKNITIHLNKFKGDPDPDQTYACVLVDISTKGAGMVINDKMKALVSEGMNIYLLDITDQKLPSPFQTEITYIKPYDENIPGHLYKVGIRFTEELDSVSYKSITSVIEIKQKKVRGISDSFFCGLNFEDYTKIISDIEATNQQLALNIMDNVEYLDKLRYLTTGMKIEFLQSLPHDLLATSLRLSSKELVYDLLSELTQTMIDEFLEKLQHIKPASAICKAQDQIIKLIKEKEASGEFILDPTSFVTYV